MYTIDEFQQRLSEYESKWFIINEQREFWSILAAIYDIRIKVNIDVVRVSLLYLEMHPIVCNALTNVIRRNKNLWNECVMTEPMELSSSRKNQTRAKYVYLPIYPSITKNSSMNARHIISVALPHDTGQ